MSNDLKPHEIPEIAKDVMRYMGRYDCPIDEAISDLDFPVSPQDAKAIKALIEDIQRSDAAAIEAEGRPGGAQR